MTGQAPTTDFADVVIVGGGPAGLAAAIALGQKGIECIVVEALEPPIDKCCGEGLMPDALHSLKALGVEIREQHTPCRRRFSERSRNRGAAHSSASEDERSRLRSRGEADVGQPRNFAKPERGNGKWRANTLSMVDRSGWHGVARAQMGWPGRGEGIQPACLLSPSLSD